MTSSSMADVTSQPGTPAERPKTLGSPTHGLTRSRLGVPYAGKLGANGISDSTSSLNDPGVTVDDDPGGVTLSVPTMVERDPPAMAERDPPATTERDPPTVVERDPPPHIVTSESSVSSVNTSTFSIIPGTMTPDHVKKVCIHSPPPRITIGLTLTARGSTLVVRI